MSDSAHENSLESNSFGVSGAASSQTFFPSLVDRRHYGERSGHGDPQQLQKALIKSGRLGDPENLSVYALALSPLLMALNWRGQFRQLCEALPQRNVNITESELRNILARLGYVSDKAFVHMNQLDERLVPCVYTGKDGTVFTVLAKDDYGTTVFNTFLDRADIIAHDELIKGEAIFFYDRYDAHIPEHLQNRLPRASDQGCWSHYVLRRFSGLIKQALAMSLMINLLGLVAPFLVMAVLGVVVSTQNLTTLAWFCLGGAIAVAAEIALRLLRGEIMGTISARLDHIFSVSLFDKVLRLPLQFTENSTVSAQMARLRDYMSVGQFISGSLMVSLLDLPFVIILLGAMALFSVKMAALTLISMGVFAIIAISMKRLIRRTITNGADANVRKQEIIIETLENRDMLLRANGVDAWISQYRDSCGNAAKASMKTFLLGSILETSGYTMTMLAGVAIVSVGIFDVLAGVMPIGGLVGSIILLWRIINPVQTVLSNLPRIEQIGSSLKQIDRLMQMDAEHDGYIKTQSLGRLRGDIFVSRVSIRHTPDSEPALLGVNFETKAGEMLAITGANGSGKSTLFKVLIGLYRPQAGQIQIDGVDIRQMNPAELRHAIGYMPQKAALFPGTIASNLRLSDPTAREEDMRDVMMFVQGLDAINALPNGLETCISDDQSHEISDSLVQKISLARAMIGRPGILLIDEIEGVFTQAEKIIFLGHLQNMEDRPTILFSTQDDVIIRACNQVLIFNNGELTPAENIPN